MAVGPLVEGPGGAEPAQAQAPELELEGGAIGQQFSGAQYQHLG